jgi:hypothetical protein
VATAACVWVRGACFEKVGGFDTGYRNGFEDVDLCLRLGELGHEIHYCAQAVLVHLESVSPGRFRYDRENVMLYRERWMEQVRPDDFDYYVTDGFIRVSYEGRYPLGLEVSPLLATLDDRGRESDTELLLRDRSRQVAELERENTHLRLELGRCEPDSSGARYGLLRLRIRQVVEQAVPMGATVAVISKGDGALLRLVGRTGWHFPQTDRGAYAGRHPADSAEAIGQLEALRRRGAEFLVIPATSHWWLDHYQEFRRHLEACCIRQPVLDDSCVIYALKAPTRAPVSCP